MTDITNSDVLLTCKAELDTRVGASRVLGPYKRPTSFCFGSIRHLVSDEQGKRILADLVEMYPEAALQALAEQGMSLDYIEERIAQEVA